MKVIVNKRWAVCTKSFVCLLCCVLLACAEKPSYELSLLDDDAVILAFGDSLTFGTGVPHSQSYPAVLNQLLPQKVVRSGVPGELSSAGLKRLPEVLQEYSPQLVVLCHAGNDILRKKDKALAEDNLVRMIDLIRESGAEVILLGVPSIGLSFEVAPFYQRAAARTGVVFDGELIPSLEASPSLKSDVVHFNQQGYRKMAEAIAEILDDAGALL